MLRHSLNQLEHHLKLAVRNLVRHRRRSALALGTVGGGVVALLLASGFIHWIFQDMRESTIHSQLGHIQITRTDYFSKGQADPYRYLLPPLSKVQPVFRSISPAPQTVAPRLAFSGLLSMGDATVSFIGEGIDPVKEGPITRAITIRQGRDLTANDDNAVLLGEGLAASIGAQPGNRVVLLVTSENGSPNAVECVVAGIFSTITKAYDDVALRAPITMARSLMRVDGATSWVVLLDKTSQTDEVATQLRAALETNDYEIFPWYALADFYNKTVELFSRQINVVRLLIAFIVILSISNTLTMSVLERTNEIGTSMAIGQKRRDILQLFIAEGVLIGVVGGAAGVVLGSALAALISSIGIPMPPPPGMAHGYIGQIEVSMTLVMDAMKLAVLTTLLASLFPAWKASRMTIVDALRHQR